MKEISFDDEDKLDVLKTLFKGVFEDNWKQEFLDYLKISCIEEKTKLHLKSQEKKLDTVYSHLEGCFQKKILR